MIVFITVMTPIFEEVYHEKTSIAGLNFLALGIGLTGASQINARALDRAYIYFKKRNGGVGEPEFRLRKSWVYESA
jgi:hypothetical protein